MAIPALSAADNASPTAHGLDFSADPDAVSAVAEAHRLAYGHLFNSAFATETSLIDPLPHQRIAVYQRMLDQSPLRFLLADDAGAWQDDHDRSIHSGDAGPTSHTASARCATGRTGRQLGKGDAGALSPTLPNRREEWMRGRAIRSPAGKATWR